MGEGDAAANYLKKVVKEGGVVMFVLNIDNEEARNFLIWLVSLLQPQNN